jgi:hypothetical protein
MTNCLLCREDILTTDPSSVIWELPKEINCSYDIRAVWIHPNCLSTLDSFPSFAVESSVYHSHLISIQPETIDTIVVTPPSPTPIYYYIQHHTNPSKPPIINPISSFEYAEITTKK